MHKWEPTEEFYLKQYCAIKTDKEIAQHLKIGLIAVRRKRQSLGIKKVGGRGLSEIKKIDNIKFFK